MITPHVQSSSKLLAGIVALAVAGGCTSEPAPPAQDHGGHSAPASTDAAAPDLARDDVAYLTQLFLAKGHLRVGVELCRQGAFELADVHMKHPHDELYADLVPAFTTRGLPGFADELTALAASVEGRRPIAEVEAAHAAVVAAIDRAANAAGAMRDAGQMVAVAGRLVRTAADEYALGVQGGRVVEPKEYQDAWGFTQIAAEQVKGLASRGGSTSQTTDVLTRLDALAPAWPSVVPPDTIDSGASALADAATYIEGLAATPAPTPRR